VNHPSVIAWDNGNEGGSNPELDDEFARYDPQRRPVLHPWELSFRGLNTQHYREFAETQKFAGGPDIFLPTEFLHGLFDGGSGAGLDDYWKILGEAPHAAGGFLWAWSEEAVVRSDLGGRLDANRDLGPDGLVGPHGEKSGSFNAIREIWCPVQIETGPLPADFTGELAVRNRHDFLNLNAITFEWRLMKFSPPGALLFHRTLLASGRVPGPDVAARTDGKLSLPLPPDWREADVLYLTAIDSRQRELYTWAWRWKTGAAVIGSASNCTTKSVSMNLRRRSRSPPGAIPCVSIAPRAACTDSPAMGIRFRWAMVRVWWRIVGRTESSSRSPVRTAG
jgi:hypothetical protein